MDKIKDIFFKCIDFVVEQKRYFGAGIVCVLMVVVLAFGTDNSAADSNPLSGAYQSYSEEDTDSEISTLLTTYYNACANNDLDTLATVAYPVSDAEKSYITFLSDYIDSYDVLSVYTKRGVDSDSYLVSAEVDVHFTGISTAAPGLDFFYVIKNEETGSLVINNVYSAFNQQNNEYDMDPTISSLIAEFEQQEDLLALQADVQARYNEGQLADADFNKFTSETLPQAIQKWASDYKTALAEAQKQAEEEAKKAEEEAAKAEDEAKKAEEEAAKAAEKEANAYTVRVTDKVNVRTSASTDADSLGKVDAGTELKAYSEEGEWTLVVFNDQEGYIKTEFLERVDASTEETTEEATDETTTEETTEEASSESASTTLYAQGEKVLLYTTVNIRESMSEDASKVALAYAGEYVEVIMQYEEGWTKVSYNGKEGYIKTEFLGPQ